MCWVQIVVVFSEDFRKWCIFSTISANLRPEHVFLKYGFLNLNSSHYTVSLFFFPLPTVSIVYLLPAQREKKTVIKAPMTTQCCTNQRLRHQVTNSIWKWWHTLLLEEVNTTKPFVTFNLCRLARYAVESDRAVVCKTLCSRNRSVVTKCSYIHAPVQYVQYCILFFLQIGPTRKTKLWQHHNDINLSSAYRRLTPVSQISVLSGAFCT